MTWFRLDDTWQTHPKMRAIGPLGRELWLAGGLHCAQQLTDGRIDKGILPILIAQAQSKRTYVAKIVEAGLWHDEGDHYVVHDWVDYQPTRADVVNQRASWSRRKALQNDPELKEKVKKRDNEKCRYCGQKVNWRDRRGEAGGTYDHVDPDGPNTLQNLVVACRSCNSRKGSRTPDEARMPLLRPDQNLTGGSENGQKNLTQNLVNDLATRPDPSHIENKVVQSSSVVQPPGGAATQRVMAEAVEIVLERRDKVTESLGADNPDGWLAGARKGILAELDQAGAWNDITDGATPEQVAGLISATRRSKANDIVHQTVPANQSTIVLATQTTPPACTTCGRDPRDHDDHCPECNPDAPPPRSTP